MERIKQYWKPGSLAFWGAVALFISGVLEVSGSAIPGVSVWARPIIDAYFGATGPIVKIGMGMGILGIRRVLPDGN